MENLNRFRDTPARRIRLNVVEDAAGLLLAPVMPLFMDRYPDIEVEIVASNRMVDMTGDVFDAGIRFGGTVPENMITQRLPADFRWMVAAAPAYLDRFGMPEQPEDLLEHRCLGVRLSDDRLYRWEFEGPEGEVALTVPSRITVSGSTTLGDGAGLI